MLELDPLLARVRLYRERGADFETALDVARRVLGYRQIIGLRGKLWWVPPA